MEQFRALLADFERVLGSDAPDTLMTARGVAFYTRSRRREAEA